MADEGPEVTVSVTPGDESPTDGSASESTAVAAGHAEANAQTALETAESAEIVAESAQMVADAAIDHSYDTDSRLANLETIVTGMAAQQAATNESIAQLVELVRTQTELGIKENTPDPDPVTPDIAPKPSGWMHKKIKW